MQEWVINKAPTAKFRPVRVRDRRGREMMALERETSLISTKQIQKHVEKERRTDTVTSKGRLGKKKRKII